MATRPTSAALNKALEKWKKDQAQEKKNKLAEEKKKQKAPAKKAAAKKNDKLSEVKDLKAHLRSVNVIQNTTVPISKQIKDSLQCLQKSQVYMSPEELLESTTFSCAPGTTLHEQLVRNPKLTYLNGKFKFKTNSDILLHGKEDVFRYIAQSGSCMVKDLSIIYAEAATDVATLHKEKRVWLLPSDVKDQNIVFVNQHKLTDRISENVSKMWHSVQIPEDPEEFAKELRRANITSAINRSKVERLKTSTKKKRKAPSFNRFTRITNQHLPELFIGDGAASID